jgi:hypothetical protein
VVDSRDAAFRKYSLYPVAFLSDKQRYVKGLYRAHAEYNGAESTYGTTIDFSSCIAAAGTSNDQLDGQDNLLTCTCSLFFSEPRE